MYKVINISGKGVPMECNGATAIIMQKVFGMDITRLFAGQVVKAAEQIEYVTKLAYVLVKQAEKVDYKQLNEEDYISFMAAYEPLDFFNEFEEIAELYSGKKLSEEQADE